MLASSPTNSRDLSVHNSFHHPHGQRREGEYSPSFSNPETYQPRIARFFSTSSPISTDIKKSSDIPLICLSHSHSMFTSQFHLHVHCSINSAIRQPWHPDPAQPTHLFVLYRDTKQSIKISPFLYIKHLQQRGLSTFAVLQMHK